MIANISLVDCCEDEWTYQLIYNYRKMEPHSSPIPFDEMAPLEKSRFISEIFAPAFMQEQFEVLDARPKEVAEGYLGVDLDAGEDEEDEDEDYTAASIVDLLTELQKRIEDIEIRLNKKEDGNGKG